MTAPKKRLQGFGRELGWNSTKGIKMKSHKTLFLASTVMTVVFAAAPAYADDATQIETVTVTAEKRSEDIQKVPFQVTAFSPSELAASERPSLNNTTLSPG